MENKLIKEINQMLESCLRYKRKTDPKTLEEYYEGSVRLRDLTKFDEEELDFVFKYLDSRDILVLGTSPALYSDYPNYRFVKKLDGPRLAIQITPDETEKLLVEYKSLEDEDENKNLDMRDMMQFDSKILMYLGVGIALGALGVYLLRR